MTQEQKEQIKRLRGQGFGYKRVADILSLPEGTVKTFCRREGLSGMLAREDAQTPEEHFCKFCGLPVIQNKGRKAKLYCNDECRMNFWKAHQDQVKHKAVYSYECPHCHKPFIAYGNSHRKYCSHECYIEDRFGGDKHDEG